MGSKLKLSYRPYTLELKHVFTVAAGSRSTTPVVLTEIDYDGVKGYGESSMPPYLGESHESVLNFLNKVDLTQFNDPFLVDDILDYVDSVEEGNNAAKAGIDIALHDLIGKLCGLPLYKMWGFNPGNTPNTSYTIGIDEPEIISKKVKEAGEYKILKVKLGLGNDREIIETIRGITDKPLTVDANQGWKDREFALDMIHFLKDKNVEFVEQPMPKEQIDDIAWLTENSPLPIIADESCKRLKDVSELNGVFSGINIKLMKCTGLREAKKMIELARAFNMKVMIGCMTETSCAVSAAANLSPKVDWADLDGNLLISNDPYEGVKVKDGKIILSSNPGIGLYD